MPTENLSPDGNVNALWSTYDYSNVAVEDDGLAAIANTSNDIEEQKWSIENPAILEEATSVSLEVRWRLLDDGDPSTEFDLTIKLYADTTLLDSATHTGSSTGDGWVTDFLPYGTTLNQAELDSLIVGCLAPTLPPTFSVEVDYIKVAATGPLPSVSTTVEDPLVIEVVPKIEPLDLTLSPLVIELVPQTIGQVDSTLILIDLVPQTVQTEKGIDCSTLLIDLEPQTAGTTQSVSPDPLLIDLVPVESEASNSTSPDPLLIDLIPQIPDLISALIQEFTIIRVALQQPTTAMIFSDLVQPVGADAVIVAGAVAARSTTPEPVPIDLEPQTAGTTQGTTPAPVLIDLVPVVPDAGLYVDPDPLLIDLVLGTTLPQSSVVSITALVIDLVPQAPTHDTELVLSQLSVTVVPSAISSSVSYSGVSAVLIDLVPQTATDSQSVSPDPLPAELVPVVPDTSLAASPQGGAGNIILLEPQAVTQTLSMTVASVLVDLEPQSTSPAIKPGFQVVLIDLEPQAVDTTLSLTFSSAPVDLEPQAPNTTLNTTLTTVLIDTEPQNVDATTSITPTSVLIDLELQTADTTLSLILSPAPIDLEPQAHSTTLITNLTTVLIDLEPQIPAFSSAVPSAPDLLAADDTGISDTDDITSLLTVRLLFTNLLPGESVTLVSYLNGVRTEETPAQTADGSGEAEFTFTGPYGDYQFAGLTSVGEGNKLDVSLIPFERRANTLNADQLTS